MNQDNTFSGGNSHSILASSLTHPHVVQNLYEFLSSMEYRIRYLFQLFLKGGVFTSSFVHRRNKVRFGSQLLRERKSSIVKMLSKNKSMLSLWSFFVQCCFAHYVYAAGLRQIPRGRL